MDNNAIGRDAIEFIDSHLTPDEIAESNLQVELIGELVEDNQERSLK